MLLPYGYFIEFFWADESLVLFPSTKKVREKLNIWFVHFASNFWPVTNIRKTWTWEFVLSLNSWNLNLKSKRVHLPRSCQKSLSIAPWRRNEERRGWAVFCHTESRKKSQRSQKAKRSSNQIKGYKGETHECWSLGSVLAAQWRKSKSLQHLVFPGGLPSKY